MVSTSYLVNLACIRSNTGCRVRAYHFKVTWPFWTRFMLKPTVGMELLEKALGEGAFCWNGHSRAIYVATTYSMVNSPPWRVKPSVYVGRRRGKHTARTRNNDVLPAFCKPIMVTSISVALHTSSTCQQRVQNSWRGYDEREMSRLRIAGRQDGWMEAAGERSGRRTKTGAAANHICSGRSWPLLWIEVYGQVQWILSFWEGWKWEMMKGCWWLVAKIKGPVVGERMR